MYKALFDRVEFDHDAIRCQHSRRDGLIFLNVDNRRHFGNPHIRPKCMFFVEVRLDRDSLFNFRDEVLGQSLVERDARLDGQCRMHIQPVLLEIRVHAWERAFHHSPIIPTAIAQVRDIPPRPFPVIISPMFDRSFIQWWVGRVTPFRDVTPEKLEAEREAIEHLQEYNKHYTDFLQDAVFPVVDDLVKLLAKSRVVHRVSTWGNQLAMRVHLTWRWGELVISQTHEDCVTFEHHIITEGEKRGEERADDHSHQYDLRDPLPKTIAEQELQFFLGRLAQDLVEPDTEPEIPPGKEE